MKKVFTRQNLTAKNITLAAFVLTEIILYIIFNVLCIIYPAEQRVLKYTGVVLCFAVAVISAFLDGWDADYLILAVGLFFTVIADLFILVLDSYIEVGIAAFTVVQSVYLYRLYLKRLKKIYITLAVRLSLMLAVIIYSAVSGQKLIVYEAGTYIIMLAANCIDSAILCGGKRGEGAANVLFTVGLFLFLGCDAFSGVEGMIQIFSLTLPAAFTKFVRIIIWIFYLPSQVCITLSHKKGGLSAGLIKLREGGGGDKA